MYIYIIYYNMYIYIYNTLYNIEYIKKIKNRLVHNACCMIVWGFIQPISGEYFERFIAGYIQPYIRYAGNVNTPLGA